MWDLMTKTAYKKTAEDVMGGMVREMQRLEGIAEGWKDLQALKAQGVSGPAVEALEQLLMRMVVNNPHSL